ncbi:PAS domain S-box protein [Haloferax profundi]|uniref:Diguanylate cyclase n=1 Tax=Haloferax profundi TaxID=1544718 RepID=A0A0W1SW76_9EURY|nr:PAS domain S-box protein [Haloferax profundi]KTG30713.1 hypothetical protein AUR66_06575 [Haloferax profundi]
MSPGAAAILGIDEEEALNQDVVDVVLSRFEITRQALNSVIETQSPVPIERRGSDCPDCSGWMLPDDDGILLVLIGQAAVSAEETDESPFDGETERRKALLRHTEALAETGGWEADLEEGELRWTRGTRKIHDVSDEYQPTVDKALSFYHPADRQTVIKAIERAADNGEPYDIEARIRTATGRKRWVRSVGEPVYADGTIVKFRGAIRDITDEHDQQQSIKLLRRAIDNAPVGVTLADMDQDDEPLIYVNDAFEDLTGYSEADSLGRNCRFLQGPETDPETVASIRDAIDEHDTVTVELRNYRKDGTQFWNRVTLAPVTDSSGDVSHYIGFQADVTERKQAEKQLRQFKRAVESSGHAIYITDVDGEIQYVNERFEALTGYSVDDAVGNTPAILNSGKMPPEYFERLWDEITAGNAFEERIVDKDSDGRLYHAHQTISPLTDEDGDVTGFIAVQTDITDRIERDQQVAVLDRVLRHNLRNDMNIILGHADRLEGQLDGNLAESAAKIQSTGEQLMALAEKERTIAELFSDPPEARSLQVSRLVDSAVASVRAEYPEASISVTAPDHVSVTVTGQIEHALRELIENAIVHTDQDEPTVEIDVTSTEQTATISIADRGPGIPEIERELVTADSLPDSLYHTDGIGLWLASWITGRAGSSIEFEDREPHGTVVRVSLPCSNE